MIRKNMPDNYKKYISSLSYFWSQKTNLPKKELEAECWFAYAKALKNHNPNKPFKPYLKALAVNEMVKYTKKFKSIPRLSYEPESNIPGPESEAIFRDTMSNLSNEAMEIINIVMDCPDELLQMIRAGKNKMTKQKLCKYLVSKKGWKEILVLHCFKEIAGIWT